MPYCLYVRKSRADAEAEARGEGETLARHVAALLALARRRGLEVGKIYKEIVSGDTISGRPMMQELLSDVSAGRWEGVLVMEIERLARGDTIDQGIIAQTFKFSGTRIITPIKDYDPTDEFDEEFFEFGLFMSRREYKTIHRRLERGRIASVQEGKFVGNRPPFGYRREKLTGESGFTLAPDPEEAETVRLIYSLFLDDDLGISLIVRRLNDLHVPTRGGGRWSPATVRGILTNPVYIGKIRWNARKTVKQMVGGSVKATRPRSSDVLIVDGRHPPLVELEDFERVRQRLLDSSRPRVFDLGVVKNPLSGLVVCAKCGKKMIRKPYKSARIHDALVCPDSACDNISAPLYLVEARVLDALRVWLSGYRVSLRDSRPAPHKKSAKEKAAARLNSEVATLQMQLDALHDLLEQGIYSPETFISRSAAVSARLEKAKTEAADLASELQAESDREAVAISIVPKVEHLLDVYDDLPDAGAKNELLRSVLEKVVYIKTHRINRFTPDTFEIEIFPRIPHK